MVTSRKKKKQQIEISVGIFLLLIVAVSIGLYSYHKLTTEEITIESKSLCPQNSEYISGHSIFLIDLTDKYSSTQKDALTVGFYNKITNLPEHHRVSVFTLTDDLESGRSPIISLCTPRKFDSRRDNEFTTSKDFLENKFKKHFIHPLESKLNTLIVDNSSKKASPIFEMIQLVKIDGFDKYPIGKGTNKSLIIYSDMLHHTSEFSLYQIKPPNHLDFMSSNYGMKVSPNLKGIDVELKLLMNQPQLQGSQLIQFWRELIKDRGGRIESIEHLPG
jgi:hypothetical protein